MDWAESKRTAIKAFQQNNPQYSRDFHDKVYDEPHATNRIKHNFGKYFELAISGAVGALAITSIVFGFFQSLSFDVLAPLLSKNGIPISENEFLCWRFYACALSTASILIGFGLTCSYLDMLKRSEYKTLYESERNRELWECDNYIEGEQKEMILLYIGKGMDKEDAETVVKIMSKNKKCFVDVMMKEELELMPHDDTVNPFLRALVICLSHVLVGSCPFAAMAMWILQRSPSAYHANSLVLSFIVTLLALVLVVGSLKSLTCLTPRWKCTFQMLLNCIGGCAFSFASSYSVQHLCF